MARRPPSRAGESAGEGGLFPEEEKGRRAPLADRMRPRVLAEVVGQEAWTAPGGFFERALTGERLPSMILWGPPGSGKTTLARILARESGLPFEGLSAVLSGVAEIRGVVERARRPNADRGTILFVDEIHHFHKGQQDAFLPHVEDGTLILVGATTENPSFHLNAALLSRCRVVVLAPLGEEAIRALLERSLNDGERGLGESGARVAPEALAAIARNADGDARHALNQLETLVSLSRARVAEGRELGLEELTRALSRRALRHDRAGEAHFDLISAFHKSLRGSDADAALYWLARMLAGGEPGLYLARRMVRFASEDVGNADPQALTLALAAMESYRFLGSPEGDLALAQAAVYLALAPKSNALYLALGQAMEAARAGSHPVPLPLRNAPTRLMRDLGYGEGYRYPHDYEGAWVAEEYLPEALRGARFYQPVERGFERTLAQRQAWWRGKKEAGG